MVSLTTPICDFGWQAPDFLLPGTDGRQHSLATARGPRGLLLMFICNHCPYVKAILPRLLRDCRELREQHGIGSIAVMSNDPADYPEDTFPQMQALAREWDLPFPYVVDETQAVARAYGAVCTPDFFGFNADLQLQYRGRLDDTGRNPPRPDAPRELFAAMVQVAASGKGPAQQTPSIGCSIKWKQG
ncbi:MAG TPA: thioredoxin family protein [Azospira sp.]|nr:thioredoxin family protein [Azospira sp.]